MTHLFLNGTPPAADDLQFAVVNNYGHFTAMRVEDGAVRGLDLHLDRLAQATRELFSSDLDRDLLRAWLRNAIGVTQGKLSLRVNVFSRAFDRARPLASAAPDVLISLAPSPAETHAPLRLKSFRYARELPHIKHVGTFPLFHYRGLAQRAGYDDALFVDDDGVISEASIWNIGFFDGKRIVWPQAPQLDGVGMQLLRRGLAQLGVADDVRLVRLADLRTFHAAFVTNGATIARLVSEADGRTFALDAELIRLHERAYEANPPQQP